KLMTGAPASKSFVMMNTPTALAAVVVKTRHALLENPPAPAMFALPKRAVLAGWPDSKSEKKLPACSVADQPNKANAVTRGVNLRRGIFFITLTLSFSDRFEGRREKS